MYNLNVKGVIYADFLFSRIIVIGIFIFSTTSCTQNIFHEYNAELIYQSKAETGNAALWHPDRKSVLWVDTEGNQLNEYIPSEDKYSSWTFSSNVGSVVPETENTVILALEKKIVRFNLQTGSKEIIVPIAVEDGNLRCNDSKCSPNGRLWVGTESRDQQKRVGTAYCVHSDGQVNEKFKGLSAANGIVWSNNRKFMYHNDIPNRIVRRYRYDSKSEEVIHNGVAITIPAGTGTPDGMTIDRQDNLWIPQKGGFGVYCYNSYTGQLLAKVNVPSPNVTSCAFGGENLDTLFITTSCKGLTEEQLKEFPFSGSVFACKVAPVGVKPFYFGKKNF